MSAKKKKTIEEKIDTVEIDEIKTIDVKKDLPIVKKDSTINVGKIYVLKEGQVLPKEIEKKFYESLKTQGII